jgi:hypothetical protein
MHVEVEPGERSRRGDSFIDGENIYPIEQEISLELPLGYSVDEDSVRPSSPIGIVLHVFYVNLLGEFRAYLRHIPFSADIFISTDAEEKRGVIAACFADWTLGRVTVKVVPNRGRDIAPKIVGFSEVYDHYEYVLHLHTKQSLHDTSLVGWRGYLLDTLLGSSDAVRGVFACFAAAPRLGMLAPQHIDYLRPWIRWVENYAIAEATAKRMGFDLPPPHAPLEFPSGSMFWARSAALRPLLDLRLSFESFAEESAQTDGTLAHAIERLYFHVCERAGYDWIKITAADQLHDQRNVVDVASNAELEQFLTRVPLRLSSNNESRLVEPKILSPSPKPRRMLHVLWRELLGKGRTVPAGTRLAIVLLGEAARDRKLARAAQLATTDLPYGVIGDVICFSADSTEWSVRNEALATGFASGADVALLVTRSGVLHPASGEAVLRMALAHAGAALIESSIVPDLSPRETDPQNLTQSWAGGPVLAFTRRLFEVTGGFAPGLEGEAAEREFSSRALAHGFAVLRCPLCLFAPAGQR